MLLTSVNDIDTYLDGTKQSLTTMQLRNYRKQMGTGAIDAYQLLMQIEGTPCLKAKVGVQQQLSLDKYFGKASANLTYLGVEISQADRTKLGISAEPTLRVRETEAALHQAGRGPNNGQGGCRRQRSRHGDIDGRHGDRQGVRRHRPRGTDRKWRLVVI